MGPRPRLVAARAPPPVRADRAPPSARSATASQPLARRVLERLAKTGVAAVTKRDLFQALKGGASDWKAADLDPALALLCGHGYLRPAPDAPGPAAPPSGSR